MEQPLSGSTYRIDRQDQQRTAWTERQAAPYLGVAVRTLQQWRFLCKGPKYLKIGKAVRYRQEDLDAYMDRVTVDPGA